MFRVQGSIFDDGPASQARIDADLITTLCAVGFSAGRLAVGHPIEFSWDPGKPEDEKETAQAVAGLRRAVGDVGIHLAVRKAPDWHEGSLITGAAGSASSPFSTRHAMPSTEAAKQLLEIAARDTTVGYQGVGAYTGFVDVPFTNVGSVKSTKRFNVPATTFGQRWRPPTYSYPNAPDLNQVNAPWGLLNGGAAIEGMAADQPAPGGVVGYTHGMIQSVYDAVAIGPWCTPFEIAVGTKTTKVASCFACTLFMYAAGFPPSSIHLGRGDSWAPFYPVEQTAQGYSMMVDESFRSTNVRWALECWQHLSLGMDLAHKSPFLDPDHAARLGALQAFLDSRPNDTFAAANLLLDALTVHDSFARRISRAIPVGS